MPDLENWGMLQSYLASEESWLCLHWLGRPRTSVLIVLRTTESEVGFAIFRAGERALPGSTDHSRQGPLRRSSSMLLHTPPLTGDHCIRGGELKKRAAVNKTDSTIHSAWCNLQFSSFQQYSPNECGPWAGSSVSSGINIFLLYFNEENEILLSFLSLPPVGGVWHLTTVLWKKY